MVHATSAITFASLILNAATSYALPLSLGGANGMERVMARALSLGASEPIISRREKTGLTDTPKVVADKEPHVLYKRSNNKGDPYGSAYAGALAGAVAGIMSEASVLNLATALPNGAVPPSATLPPNNAAMAGSTMAPPNAANPPTSPLAVPPVGTPAATMPGSAGVPPNAGSPPMGTVQIGSIPNASLPPSPTPNLAPRCTSSRNSCRQWELCRLDTFRTQQTPRLRFSLHQPPPQQRLIARALPPTQEARQWEVFRLAHPLLFQTSVQHRLPLRLMRACLPTTQLPLGRPALQFLPLVLRQLNVWRSLLVQ